MGLLDGVMGNASRVDSETVAHEYSRLLSEGEQVHAAYQLVRDVIILTSNRLMYVNKQGISGKKVDYQSVPYRSISMFSVETAGPFDLDAELNTWVSGRQNPLSFKFSKKGADVYEVQALLAAFVATR